MKFRVLLVDDHAVIRAGLRALINAQADLEVIGEAKDGAEALAVACQTQPDIVLMDLSMPGHGGLPAIASIRKSCPHTQVLVLTMHNDPAYLRLVLAAGGAGYVVKTAADTEVLTAIHAVVQGRTFVDMSFGQHPATASLDQDQSTSGPVQERSLLLLSAREREVLDLVAHGHTNQEVAERLKLSVKSVETYRARLMDKLQLKSRADLVRFALENGLLAPENPDSPE